MKHRMKIIAVPLDDTTFLMRAKYQHVGTAPEPLPPCAWCGATDTYVLLELTQWGFEADLHQLISYCDECQNATVLYYEVQHE